MNPIDILIPKLKAIIALEGTESVETLSGYIVGEILGDYEGIYESLYENDPVVEQIAELASDLEWSNGQPEDLPVMWETIKQFTELLEKEQN